MLTAIAQTLPGLASMAFGRGLPHFAEGLVIKGFGRGSKSLGIPTANFPEEVVDNLPEEISPGVYFGYASVANGLVHKMVMSIGWNPFYKNEKKSMETYIMHEFDKDFYGDKLKIVMLGYIRAEENFSSVDELITAIKNDIKLAEEKLDSPEFIPYKQHNFFSTS